MNNRPAVKIKTDWFFILAISFLIIPFEWVFAWLIASFVHELFHYAALKICGCRIHAIQIGLNGIQMDTQINYSFHEILCTLSGPIGGLLLLFIGKWCPRIALCAFFQSVYNLIPIYPFDGGRVLRCFLRTFLSENASAKVERCLEYIIFLFVLIIGIYGTFVLKLGFAPLVLSVFLIIRNKQGKSTCKEGTLGVK